MPRTSAKTGIKAVVAAFALSESAPELTSPVLGVPVGGPPEAVTVTIFVAAGAHTPEAPTALVYTAVVTTLAVVLLGYEAMEDGPTAVVFTTAEDATATLVSLAHLGTREEPTVVEPGWMLLITGVVVGPGWMLLIISVVVGPGSKLLLTSVPLTTLLLTSVPLTTLLLTSVPLTTLLGYTVT